MPESVGVGVGVGFGVIGVAVVDGVGVGAATRCKLKESQIFGRKETLLARGREKGKPRREKIKEGR